MSNDDQYKVQIVDVAQRASIWINDNSVCSVTLIAPDMCTGKRVWKFSRPSGKVAKHAPFIHRYVSDDEIVMLARDRGFQPVWRKQEDQYDVE